MGSRKCCFKLLLFLLFLRNTASIPTSPQYQSGYNDGNTNSYQHRAQSSSKFLRNEQQLESEFRNVGDQHTGQYEYRRPIQHVQAAQYPVQPAASFLPTANWNPQQRRLITKQNLYQEQPLQRQIAAVRKHDSYGNVPPFTPEHEVGPENIINNFIHNIENDVPIGNYGYRKPINKDLLRSEEVGNVIEPTNVIEKRIVSIPNQHVPAVSQQVNYKPINPNLFRDVPKEIQRIESRNIAEERYEDPVENYPIPDINNYQARKVVRPDIKVPVYKQQVSSNYPPETYQSYKQRPVLPQRPVTHYTLPIEPHHPHSKYMVVYPDGQVVYTNSTPRQLLKPSVWEDRRPGLPYEKAVLPIRPGHDLPTIPPTKPVQALPPPLSEFPFPGLPIKDKNQFLLPLPGVLNNGTKPNATNSIPIPIPEIPHNGIILNSTNPFPIPLLFPDPELSNNSTTPNNTNSFPLPNSTIQFPFAGFPLLNTTLLNLFAPNGTLAFPFPIPGFPDHGTNSNETNFSPFPFPFPRLLHNITKLNATNPFPFPYPNGTIQFPFPIPGFHHHNTTSFPWFASNRTFPWFAPKGSYPNTITPLLPGFPTKPLPNTMNKDLHKTVIKNKITYPNGTVVEDAIETVKKDSGAPVTTTKRTVTDPNKPSVVILNTTTSLPQKQNDTSADPKNGTNITPPDKDPTSLPPIIIELHVPAKHQVTTVIHTFVYPNGTIVEEFTETEKVNGKPPKITKTRTVHNGALSENPSNNTIPTKLTEPSSNTSNSLDPAKLADPTKEPSDQIKPPLDPATQLLNSTKPITDPTKPTDSINLQSDLTNLINNSTKLAVDPTNPTTNSNQPPKGLTEPPMDPTKTSANTNKLFSDPTKPPVIPIQVLLEPTTSPTNSTKPSTNPTNSTGAINQPMNSTKPVTDSTTPSADPTKPPTNSTQPAKNVTEAPTDPTKIPTGTTTAPVSPPKGPKKHHRHILKEIHYITHFPNNTIKDVGVYYEQVNDEKPTQSTDTLFDDDDTDPEDLVDGTNTSTSVSLTTRKGKNMKVTTTETRTVKHQPDTTVQEDLLLETLTERL